MTVRTDDADFVVVGSGAGGLAAAIRASAGGARTIVCEKESLLGGNSALSGGTMWVPDNALMREQGIPDSLDDALRYLEACIGEVGPASSRARKLAYLTEGPRLVEFLRAQGLALNRVEGYADYHDQPGAHARGRALQCDQFDLRELGEHAALLPNWNVVVGYVQEFPDLVLARRTWRGFRTAVRVGLRTFWARRVRRAMATANGPALVGRLLQIALRLGVEVRVRTPVRRLLVESGRVSGVVVECGGQERAIRARRGVLIASGGYARNLEMRRRHGRRPESTDWTFANPGETGEVVQLAMELGAATDLMDEGIWIPMAKAPFGPMYLEYERGKPHCLLVDGEAQRYVDEGTDYVTFGQRMYAHAARSPAVPSWLIFESRHRERYVFGGQLPGRTPEAWVRDGFIKRADTLESLARACGLDPIALVATVERFNGFARSGVDEDFRRGEGVFSRSAGDPRQRPNPGLGPVEKAPFYAVAVYPGDLGIFGGLLTDEHARVLRADGSVIENLYATGNATAPVMGRIYPCTGASIASTMIFGSLAAQHVLTSTGNAARTG